MAHLPPTDEFDEVVADIRSDPAFIDYLFTAFDKTMVALEEHLDTLEDLATQLLEDAKKRNGNSEHST